MPGRWRQLPPVEVPVSIEPESGELRVSQTFMRTHDRCDRAAYLTLKHEGGPGSHELNRGSVFHRFAKKATDWLIEHEENSMADDPDTAKDLLREVYVEAPELTVPNAERDAIRAMAYNWTQGTWIVPESVLGVEQSFTLPIGKWTLRCKVDLAERVGYGRVDVTDYKTSFDIPDQASFEGDYQGRLYLMSIVLGRTDAGLSLADGAEEFFYRQRFPRYLREEGLAETQPMIVTRVELLDWKLDLEDQLRRLDRNLETQEWPATPGPHCAECVAPQECPLPRHLRPDSQMAVATPEEARRLAEWWYVEKARVERAKKRLKEYSRIHGKAQIPIGQNLALTWKPREEPASKLDRQKLALEVEGAVEYGHGFDTDALLRTRTSTRFDLDRVDS